MKSYKNVELFAKNAPEGSYAAGCPMHTHSGDNQCKIPSGVPGGVTYFVNGCSACEVTR